MDKASLQQQRDRLKGELDIERARLVRERRELEEARRERDAVLAKKGPPSTNTPVVDTNINDPDPWDTSIPPYEPLPPLRWDEDMQGPAHQPRGMDQQDIMGWLEGKRWALIDSKQSTSKKDASELARLEKEYKEAKVSAVRDFLNKGDNEGAQNFLISEIELLRKENINVSMSERLASGVSKGIQVWEAWGEARIDENGVKIEASRSARLAKMATSIGLITGATSLTAGLGTEAIVGRLAVGLGMGSLMEGGDMAIGKLGKLTEKQKKVARTVLKVGMLGLSATVAIVGGGAIGVAALGASAAVGYGMPKFLKRFDDKTTKASKESILEGGIPYSSNLEATLDDFEKNYKDFLKTAEKSRIMRKIIGASATIAVSTAVIQASSWNQSGAVTPLVENVEAPNTDTDTPAPFIARDPDLNTGLDTGATVEAPQDAPTEASPVSDANEAPPAPAITNPEAGANAEQVKIGEVAFGKGEGAMQAILDLKAELNAKYQGDFSNAPAEVREFMQGNYTEQAIKSGFYNPDTNESIVVKEGARLSIGADGKLAITNPGEVVEAPLPPVEVGEEPRIMTGVPTPQPLNVKEARIEDIAKIGALKEDIFRRMEAPVVSGEPEIPEESLQNTITEGGKEIINPIPQKPTGETRFIHIDEKGVAQELAHLKNLNISDRSSGWGTEMRTGTTQIQTGTVGGISQAFDGFGQGPAGDARLDLASRMHLIPAELARNSLDLTNVQLMQVFEGYKDIIAHVIPKDVGWGWERVQGLTVNTLLKDDHFAGKHGYEGVASLIESIKSVTELEPKGGLFSRDETVREFVLRGLEKAHSLDKLDKISFTSYNK